MAKSSSQDTEDSQPPQQYDTTLKDWLRQEAARVLSILLPGAVYEETLSVELIRTTIRADKVFKVIYKDEESIFHIAHGHCSAIRKARHTGGTESVRSIMGRKLKSTENTR